MVIIEEWKDIKGFDGLYLVSNLGRVRSLRKILAPKDNGNGYKNVCLCLGKHRYYRYIHRLVAEAFIPNPDNLKEVDHIDCSRDNNAVDNLRWTTHGDNCKDATRSLRISEGKSGIRVQGLSLREVSKMTRISYVTLWKRVRAGWTDEEILTTRKRKWTRQ